MKTSSAVIITAEEIPEKISMPIMLGGGFEFFVVGQWGAFEPKGWEPLPYRKENHMVLEQHEDDNLNFWVN